MSWGRGFSAPIARLPLRVLILLIVVGPHDCFTLKSTRSDGATTTLSASEQQSPLLLTSAVLNVSYDGAHFHGWSAANDGDYIASEVIGEEEHEFEYSSTRNGADFLHPIGGKRKTKLERRRRKRTRGTGGSNNVRSVEGQIRKALAKVYSNVDPSRVQLEGCSRTDKGVHSRSMIVLMYCLTKDAALEVEERRQSSDNHDQKHIKDRNSIAGKRIPHPNSPTDDTSFERLPFGGNIDKMKFVLNRMLPPDVRINDVCTMPATEDGERPFHPSLDAAGKTYQYTFSFGHVHDPLRWRRVWHVETYGKATFDLDRAKECTDLFLGSHDFVAFRGAFRGNERGRVQESTVCDLSAVKVEKEVNDMIDYVGSSPLENVAVGGSDAARHGLEPLVTYTISVEGDRFLYKMVRFLVGTIVSVGLGKVPIDVVKLALEQGNWNDEGSDSKGKKDVMCAPSHGLALMDVKFDEGVDFQWRGDRSRRLP